jgi:hypothetical protein
MFLGLTDPDPLQSRYGSRSGFFPSLRKVLSGLKKIFSINYILKTADNVPAGKK